MHPNATKRDERRERYDDIIYAVYTKLQMIMLNIIRVIKHFTNLDDTPKVQSFLPSTQCIRWGKPAF